MKVTDRVKKIDGVEDAFWHPENLSLTVFIQSEKEEITKAKIINELDSIGLWGWAIERLNTFSIITK